MKILQILIVLLLTLELTANDKVERYIGKYKHIAIAEMERTGVPASIKLAQSLLESGWGESELSKVANNHFGIKCGKNWSGKSFYKKDDDLYDGRLVQSCFRAYEFAEESFIAHSEFLSTKRYAFLFDYHPTDYTSWAKGLQKAGYATDPAYPQKLINIIEKYELYTFDQMGLKQEIVETTNEKPILEKNNSQEEVAEVEIKTTIIDSQVYVEVESEKDKKERIFEETIVEEEADDNNALDLVYEHNGTRVYMTDQAESLNSIAEKLEMDPMHIVKYNEWILTENQLIASKKRIYLEKKKINFAGHESHHRVKRGQKMQDISDLYGVDLEALYLKNRIPRNAEPLAGELVMLKGLMRFDKRPRYKTVYEKSESKTVFEQIEYLFEDPVKESEEPEKE